MKKLLIVLMIAALAVTVSMRQVNATDAPIAIRYAPPTVTFTTGKLSYSPGETIDWRYTLYNGNDHPLVLTFMTSQVYDLILRQGGKVIARWSTGKMFADIVTTSTVMMGETMELNGSWQLPTGLALGTYDLEFILTSTTTESTGAKAQFAVDKASTADVGVASTTDKLIYRVGTTITVKYTITNLSDKPLVLNFPTTQQYDWTVTDAEGNLAYRWSAGKAFGQVVTHLTIPVGASDGFESSWTIPRNLKPNGFYVHFTLLDDSLGVLKTQRAAVLMGSTPPSH
jgi:Intracellular proteinase inhibitor